MIRAPTLKPSPHASRILPSNVKLDLVGIVVLAALLITAISSVAAI